MASNKETVFRLRVAESSFILDAQNRALWMDDPATGRTRIAVGSKELAALQFLVERAPHVVSAEQVSDALWGSQRISPSSLHTVIAKLRRTFGDRKAIENLRGFGYRFAGEVEMMLRGDQAVSYLADTGSKSQTLDPASAADFDIAFDADFSPEQVKDLLTSLADYYRSCGGAGFELDLETQEALVKEPVHV